MSDRLRDIAASFKKPKRIWVTGPTKPFDLDFIRIKALGNVGRYGITYQCKRKSNGELVVVKLINKNRFYRTAIQHRHRYLQAMSDEMDVLKALQHDFIINLSDVYTDKTTEYIVMEQCTGGDLFSRICKNDTLTEKRAANMIMQILSALRYMHDDNGIVHCNLKPHNILFLTQDKNSPIKITDFGMSKVLPRLQHLQYVNDMEYYIAPEVIKNRKYNHACDMWSVGVLLFILIYGYPPFYVDPQHYGTHAKTMLYEKVIKGFRPKVKDISVDGYGPWFPKHIRSSNEVKDLISKLLLRQVRKRYTAKEALTHPWIANRKCNGSMTLRKNSITLLKHFNAGVKYRSVMGNMFRNRFYRMRPQQFYDLEQLFMKCDRAKKGLISHEDLMKGFSLIDGDHEMRGIKLLNEAYEQLHFPNAVGFVVPYWFRRVMNKPMISICDITHIIQMYYSNPFSISVCERPMGIRYQELLQGLIYEYLIASDERLYDAFRKLDDDNDGKIITNELKKKLKEIDPLGEYHNAMKLVHYYEEQSLDYNGVIDYEEFLLNLHPNFAEEPEWMPDILKKLCSMKPHGCLIPYKLSRKKPHGRSKGKRRRHQT